jgi:hypothetical protein
MNKENGFPPSFCGKPMFALASGSLLPLHRQELLISIANIQTFAYIKSAFSLATSFTAINLSLTRRSSPLAFHDSSDSPFLCLFKDRSDVDPSTN